jgi:hypothetical protein
MSFFGVTLDVQVKKLLNDLRIYLKKKGGIGIKSLYYIFKKMDFNGNKKLDQQEFTDALGQFGFFPKIVDIQALMKYFDTNNDGNITYEEFLKGLRESMNERRMKLVDKAFNCMDKDHSGKITVADLGIELNSQCIYRGKESRVYIWAEIQRPDIWGVLGKF